MRRVPAAGSVTRTPDTPARRPGRGSRCQKGTLVRLRPRMGRLRDPETGRAVMAPAAGTGLSPARLAAVPRRPAGVFLEQRVVDELARARARTWLRHRA